MAYTIISQNNNTTTLTDGVNTITVPSRVNLTSGNFTIVEVNNNMATLEDGDGNVYRDIPCVVNLVDAGGGGGSVDTSKVVNADTLPTADASNAGYVYLYTGETDANYTHGYVYQNTVTTTYTGTVSFNPASLSSTTVACSGDDFAAFVAEWGSGNITDIIKGTLTYDQSGGLLVFVGLDDTDTQVCTFQLYTQDYEDAGFTFTGTLQDGDVINFTTTISETSSYAWERIDVQPAPEALPDQTGQSGKFLTTDGTDASWSDKPLVNNTTQTGSLSILGNQTQGSWCTVIGKQTVSFSTQTGNTIIGGSASSYASQGTVVGTSATVSMNCTAGVAVGYSSRVGAANAIQINASGNSTTNSDANTMKVANLNGNFEIMSADGTIPHARLTNAVTSTTVTIAAADWNGGTTVTKTISGLTATSVIWVAPDHASQSDYTSAGVYASSQTTDTLEFSCTTTPTNALTVTVVYC